MGTGLVILLAVVLQFAFAFIGFGAPVVGVLHGANAIVVAWLGWHAAAVAGSAEPVAAREAAAVS